MTAVVIQDGSEERMVEVAVAADTIEWHDRTWRRHGDYLARRSFTGEGIDFKLPEWQPDLPYYVEA
ncbi:hypothetical protein [Microbacterium hydrocarbonoxydans]|uniref:hypothetical protein n=1 Tax=Microbacterium hydrocarbonoxydans TaxID=273678 RepID=UPI003D97A274